MYTAVSVPELAAISPSALLSNDIFTKTPASILAESLLGLPIAERLMLSLTYFHDFPIVEAAAVMKLDAQAGSAFHARAISSLSKIVAGQNDHTISGE